MKSLGLYIHIPFCIKKCGYCDFLSFEYSPEAMANYVDHLIQELSLYQGGDHVKTIFFGGGTPSLLTGEQMNRIMAQVHKSFHVLNNAEISMESNPGTLKEADLMAYVAAGINRVSLGVQTMNDETLKTLDRIHDTETVYESIELLKKHVSNFNVDLMFGLPGQTMKQLSDTLDKIIDLKPSHISAYSLKFEEGTPFYELLDKGVMHEADETLDRSMYHYIEEKLSEAGFLQYEISNFAKEGYQCKHNLVYWLKEDYIGVGLGAHGCLNQVRYHNAEDLTTYMGMIDAGKKPVVEESPIDIEEDAFEFIILSMRLNQGLDLKTYQKKYGKDFMDQYQDILETLMKEGLIVLEEDCICLTAKGRDLSNQVFIKFLS